MTIHRNFTGAGAVHPFAIISATDPSLDADNHVAGGKAWIDTSGATPALKVRNDANSGWLAVIGGGEGSGSLLGQFVEVIEIALGAEEWAGEALAFDNWVEVETV